ncbi:MAG: Fic family protein [Coriobacteriia bacterium]|nr:Fic family protein [Coriobacteriia bacterium]
MPKYKTLKQAFHEDSSNARFANNHALAQRRREDVSSFRTGIELQTGEMFYTIPQELANLAEKILRLERKISHLWKSLPPIALGSFIRDLIAQEIVSTNRIEGIRSTRKEIEEALFSLDSLAEEKSHKRFREFANLYLNLTEESVCFPADPSEIRKIYDDIIAGELAEEDLLDGDFFRANTVNIIDGRKVLHEGVTPESKIVDMLKDMIDLVGTEDEVSIYNVLLSHFLFEYIHPFYDGNGRTGRFLLALYLSKPLSIATVLSLSGTIADNTRVYYGAFEEVEDKLNHADATFFLLEMMRLLRSAQENLLDDLVLRAKILNDGHARITSIDLQNDIERFIVYALLQNQLFSITPATQLPEIADYIDRSKTSARRYMLRLEQAEYVEVVSKRPLSFVLSERALEMLGYTSHNSNDN